MSDHNDRLARAEAKQMELEQILQRAINKTREAEEEAKAVKADNERLRIRCLNLERENERLRAMIAAIVDQTVAEYVFGETGSNLLSVGMDARFIEDLDLDSLDIVEIVVDIEEKLGITIPDRNFENVRTVGDLVKAVEQINA